IIEIVEENIDNQLEEEKDKKFVYLKIYLVDKLLNNNEQSRSIKKCLECQTSNINNKKQLCPNCNAKLSTINELKQLNEPLVIANNTEKSL
ncbi:14455_t:CDS:2, partial [Racocetra fulgida]